MIIPKQLVTEAPEPLEALINKSTCGDSRLLLSRVDSDSIDCIYMDPPFNSDSDYRLDPDSETGFNDEFDSDARYIALIEPMLIECKRALKEKGSLFFHISAAEMMIPNMLCRKHFRRVQPIFWKKSRSKNNIKNKLGATIDVIFWCSDHAKPKMNMVYQPLDEYYAANSYKNKDERGNYALGHIVYTATQKTKNKDRLYSIVHAGVTYAPKNGWRLSQEDLQSMIDDNRIHFPSKAGANPYKKIYKHESKGKPCTDLWDDVYSIAQGSEKRVYPTQKPIALLDRIIKMTTDVGDIVLDPVAGSGTTGVAASRLDRKYILFDQNIEATKICMQRIAEEGKNGI